MSNQPQHSLVDGGLRARRTRRVCLIVASDPELRKSLQALIRELDVVALGVTNALDALEVLEERAVDLVLSDERLPGPSGIMLLRSVRYRWPRVARVLFSVALGPDVLVRAINECGVHRVVSGNMHAVALRDEVRAALDEGWVAAPDCHSGRLTIPPFAANEMVRSAS